LLEVMGDGDGVLVPCVPAAAAWLASEKQRHHPFAEQGWHSLRNGLPVDHWGRWHNEPSIKGLGAGCSKNGNIARKSCCFKGKTANYFPARILLR
jgi:hypothetical protein